MTRSARKACRGRVSQRPRDPQLLLRPPRSRSRGKSTPRAAAGSLGSTSVTCPSCGEQFCAAPAGGSGDDTVAAAAAGDLLAALLLARSQQAPGRLSQAAERAVASVQGAPCPPAVAAACGHLRCAVRRVLLRSMLRSFAAAARRERCTAQGRVPGTACACLCGRQAGVDGRKESE